jgi:hypothetical protein
MLLRFHRPIDDAPGTTSGDTRARGTKPAMDGCFAVRDFGIRPVKSTLLWLSGFPLPVILLFALFFHPG